MPSLETRRRRREESSSAQGDLLEGGLDSQPLLDTSQAKTRRPKATVGEQLGAALETHKAVLPLLSIAIFAFMLYKGLGHAISMGVLTFIFFLIALLVAHDKSKILAMVYITPAGVLALKSYQYAGEDRSYMYRFVLTPMNNQLIKLVPMWIAPNLLTLLGLSVMLSAHVLCFLHSPNFDQQLPPWLCMYCALSFYLYQTIDNLDGKQARRTKSSSPLGLLFDHGCDALNCTVATLVQCSAMQTGNGLALFMTWGMTIAPFVLATWEEYYTGKLTLGVVNGPTDGQILCMIFCSTAAAFPGIWSQPMGAQLPGIFAGTRFAALPMHWLIIALGYTGVVITVLDNFRAVAANNKNTHAPTPLVVLAPFFLQGVLAVLWYRYSLSNIFSRHHRVFIYGQGFLFCNMICKLMLAHLCSYSYSPWRSVLIPLIVAVANSLLPVYAGIPAVLDESLCLFLSSGLAVVFWLHFVVCVIDEITTHLQIRCFKIKVPEPEPVARDPKNKAE